MTAKRNFNYNYGVPLPLIFGPEAQKVFDNANAEADRLRDAAADASSLSWELDMAIREVRLAENVDRRVKSMLDLKALLDRLFPPSDPKPNYSFEEISGFSHHSRKGLGFHEELLIPLPDGSTLLMGVRDGAVHFRDPEAADLARHADDGGPVPEDETITEGYGHVE